MTSISLEKLRRIGIGLALMASASACTSEKSEPAASTGVSSTPETATTWTSPVDKIPAADISKALNDAAKWPELPGEAERLCRGTPACDRPTAPARVKVRVWAAVGSKDVGHGTVGPNSALMIGKMRNMGPDTTLAYKLAPGLVYAVYLMQDERGNGKYEIWGVEGNTKARVASGKQTECGHPERKWNYSFAVFATCATSPTTHIVKNPGDLVVTWANAGVPVTHSDGPAWFTCNSGCCTSEVQ